MLSSAEWLPHLQTQTLMRMFAHDRVTVTRGSEPVFSILGACYSEYQGGPSLLMLAEVAGSILGPGYYGLHSCRSLGYQWGGVVK